MEYPGTSNNYEKKCVKLNFGLARVTIWSAQIGYVTLCSFPRAEQLYFEMNAYGTTFHHGKSIEKYMVAAARDQPIKAGRRLAEPELDLVQLLIKCRPSRT